MTHLGLGSRVQHKGPNAMHDGDFKGKMVVPVG